MFLRLYQWIKEEILRLIPLILYFGIAFNLIYFNSGLTLAPGEPRHFSVLIVTIGALFVSKVLLIADSFPFINAFPTKPLIYNIIWRFIVYLFFIFVFWIIDASLHLDDKYKDIHIVFQRLKHDVTSPVFWSSEMWLFSTFLVYIVFSEFTRVIGKDKILRILLKNRRLS